MGATFRPEDTVRKRRIVERALEDLGPGLRESVKRVLEEWKGRESEEELRSMLGDESAERVIRRIKKRS